MFEKFNIGEETKAFIVKILIPSLVAISIKLAIMSKENKITITHVMLSFVTGIGSAYLFSPLVVDYFSPHWIPIIIAVITITGEKVGNYFIYKFHVDALLDALYKKLLNWIKK